MSTCVCILEMTLINSVHEKIAFCHENKYLQKVASLKTVKLNSHEILKILQVKQSAKCNTRCYSKIKFLNRVVEKQNLSFKMSESKILSRNLQDVATECQSKNRTNLILVSFFLSRSSSKPQPKLTQSVRPGNLKCAICYKYAKSGKQKKKSELARSHKQKIFRKPLVTLRIKSTHQLQTLTLLLKCLQQIFTVIKNVTQIILGNGIELLQHFISQQEQHPKPKGEYSRTIFFS